MPLPIVDNKHAVDANALLTSMFRDKANVAGILQALAEEVQALEDAMWTLIIGRILDNAVGVTLDKWGQIVGQPRDGRTDTVYRLAIRVRIFVNRSNGLAEDIIQLILLAEPLAEGKSYQEYGTAAFVVRAFNITDSIDELASLISQTRDAGVLGEFDYSTWPFSQNFIFGSVSGGVPNQNGFIDVGLTLPPSKFVGTRSV